LQSRFDTALLVGMVPVVEGTATAPDPVGWDEPLYRNTPLTPPEKLFPSPLFPTSPGTSAKQAECGSGSANKLS